MTGQATTNTTRATSCKVANQPFEPDVDSVAALQHQCNPHRQEHSCQDDSSQEVEDRDVIVVAQFDQEGTEQDPLNGLEHPQVPLNDPGEAEVEDNAEELQELQHHPETCYTQGGIQRPVLGERVECGKHSLLD